MAVEQKDRAAREKFVVTVKPKILCMPKIFHSADELDQWGKPVQFDNKLMDFCYLKSPANHILSTSQYLLVTIHQTVVTSEIAKDDQQLIQGGYMRLWNTNDGRCIMVSPQDMFYKHRSPYRVIVLSDYLSGSSGSTLSGLLNGLVMCICQSEHIFIINVYTMTIVHQFSENFHQIEQCHINVVDGILTITLIDEQAKVKVIRTSRVNNGRLAMSTKASQMARDGSGNNSQSNFGNFKQYSDSSKNVQSDVITRTNFRQSSKLMLQNCDSHQISMGLLEQIKETFPFEVVLEAQASHKATIINRGQHRAILLINLLSASQVLVVHQDKIEVIEENGGSAGNSMFRPNQEEADQDGDTGKPMARTLMQYEEAEGQGFGGKNDANKVAWLISASVIEVNESKLLIAVDSELSVLIYDIMSLLGGRRNSMLSNQRGQAASGDDIDQKEKGRIFKANLLGMAFTSSKTEAPSKYSFARNIDQPKQEKQNSRQTLQNKAIYQQFQQLKTDTIEEVIEQVHSSLLRQARNGNLSFQFDDFSQTTNSGQSNNTSANSYILYSFFEMNGRQKLASWSLDSLLDNIFQKTLSEESSIPLYFTPIRIQGSEDLLSWNKAGEGSERSGCSKVSNQLLCLHPFIQKHYFSKHQHSFFYSDETITDQTFYIASDFPSLIIGTNYGRVFITQVFQDIECRGYPILTLDCHQGSPISCLYISYSTARKQKQMQSDFKGSDQQLAQAMASDSGGHLIAVSDNGTISVTNMNSGEIVQLLNNFSIRRNDNIKKRIDSFMTEREQNVKRRRRHSFSGHYQFQKYFNMAKISPMKCFTHCSYGPIKRILEVQILQQNQTDRLRYLQLGTSLSSNVDLSDKRKKEAELIDANGQVPNITSPLKLDEKDQDPKGASEHQFFKNGVQTYSHHLSQLNEITVGDKTSPQDIMQLNSPQQILNELSPMQSSYACIDQEQFAVYLLSISKSNQCDIASIQGLDSTPIGVYDDVLQNLVHVITIQNLNVYTFNKRSKRIIRKSNYTFAQSLLQINQTIYAMVEKQQYFKLATLQTSTLTNLEKQSGVPNYYDQYSYKQQFNEQTNILKGLARSTQMGIQGSQQQNSHHSVFDFLGLSLSLPLYYHPHNILSQKFTKTVKDLLPHRDKIRSCYQYGVSAHNHSQFDRLNRESKAVKDVIRRIVQTEFIWNDRYKSDFNQEYYQAYGAVTPLLTGSVDHGFAESHTRPYSRQQMLIINTKDMINIFRGRMRILTDSIRRQNQNDGQAQNDQSTGKANGHHHHHHHHAKGAQGPNDDQTQKVNIPVEYFQNSKWPTKLLAMVHPFSLDDNLDENLELFFGLSIPFLDCKIGIQGIDEAFSFVVASDLRDKDATIYDPLTQIEQIQDVHLSQLLQLSILENLNKKQRAFTSAVDSGTFDMIPRPLTFVNSENWKVSAYLTTIMATFFQSTLVSIIEFAQQDITTLMHDWLNALQYITSPLSLSQGPKQDQNSQQDLLAFDDQGTQESVLSVFKSAIESRVQPLSVTALSQLMLRKDHSISSCARDILMKPLLLSSTGNGTQVENVKREINEWQDLIMDTYLKLKEDSNSKTSGDLSYKQYQFGARQMQARHTSYQLEQSQQQLMAQGSGSSGSSLSYKNRQTTGVKSSSKRRNLGQLNDNINLGSQGSQGSLDQRPSPSLQPDGGSDTIFQQNKLIQLQQSQQGANADKSINHFFGEFEIRGLVNLSYYALYTQKGADELKIQLDVQNRLCKCTVILTREIMIKFTTNCNEYQNMLTILMQLLQTQMRAQVPTFKTKVIKEDVIKILLMIYDFHKKALKDERFLTRVVASNFHLTLPKNAELYLKLTAAKTLLEIGTFFTEDFLSLINEQATTLKDGPEYQRSVLDVLRYYINGQNDGRLEPYLIQIVQTLLKCLDPNDEQLRKNSTQIISVILSTMVKNFPMIAFHHESQRLAVGTITGAIAIYDVRTSQRQRILEGHAAPVLAVEFDSRGNHLASYSGQELSLRQWKIGNSSFLSGLIGSSGKNSKNVELKRLASNNPQNNSQSKRNKNDSARYRDLGDDTSASGVSSQANQKCKIQFVNNDKHLILTRENGTQEQF